MSCEQILAGSKHRPVKAHSPSKQRCYEMGTECELFKGVRQTRRRSELFAMMTAILPEAF
jgi:hypothetical protein